MKKLVLSLAVLFSVALVSCGNKEAAATDSDTMVEETAVVAEDSTAVDSTVAEVAPATDSVKAE